MKAVSTDAAALIVYVIPPLMLFTGWLWRQLFSSNAFARDNAKNIELLELKLEQDVAMAKQVCEMDHSVVMQIVDGYSGRVNTMEAKVEQFSKELISLQFTLQKVEHKQDKHHLELLNILGHPKSSGSD